MKNPKVWFAISILCTAVFFAKMPLDYHVYSTTLNSAPFWVTILVNAIYFLVPALIALIIGIVLKRK